MIKATLNEAEYIYLLNSSFLSDSWKKLINISSQSIDGLYVVNISEEQSDELRDICGEQLQLVGFDTKYCLTHEGEVLESLIDKFFVDT